MKVKSENGFTVADMAVAIIAILLFSGLIFSLMYNNNLENIKTKRQALATLYLTEALENIAIANYDEVTQENSSKFIPKDAQNDKYTMQIQINNINNNASENIIKKAIATISYKIGNKDYQYSMERIKAKI